ncbi:DNA replication protein DnaC [Mangrovibacter sp. MFB070]|nr:DNA replication protein DnaC [Mangrovibacter sp. MFB070]
MMVKKATDLLSRVRRHIPDGIRPAFTTPEEWHQWQLEQGRQRSQALARENQAMKMQRTFKRSGIRELHINCSFDNYLVECEGQALALARARKYADEFEGNIASFVFSGKPGTGKNHLAAAICNALLLHGKSVLIITVADIMSAMKGTFSEGAETTEERLIEDLSRVDLLVIDEIGVQTESRYEKVIINQIVDRRSSSKRPTGMLTNLNINEMNQLLGERVMDRMRLGNSLWVIFNWDSHRSRVTGKEY